MGGASPSGTGLFGLARLFQPDGVEVVAHVVALGGRDLLLVERIHGLFGVGALDLGILRGGLALGRLALHEVRADVGALTQLRLHLALLGVEVGGGLRARAVSLPFAEPVARLLLLLT